MPRSLPPLTSLRAFEAAARSLSFTKAARELHVTPAAISHQIRGLEQFLGVTLFQRTSRRLELTRDGQLAAEHFREAFERIARGVQALRQQGREGELVIGVTPSFATRWLLPRLPSGTLVHIHDIFLPEPYPADWAWRGYNEQGAVAAMLAGGGWDILFASHFAQARFEARLRGGPLGAYHDAAGPATSLWLAKR